MYNQPYSEEEDAIILDMKQKGAFYRDIAKVLKRGSHAIQNHFIYDLKNKMPEQKPESIEKIKNSQAQGIIDLRRSIIDGEKIANRSQCVYKHDPKKITESMILQFTDTHSGAIPHEKLAKMISTMTENTLKITQGILSNSYNLPELNIIMTGDMVTGETVYPGQAFEIYGTAFDQCNSLVSIVRNSIYSFLKYFKSVNVYAVAGNHGKANRHGSEKANFDLFFYRLLKGEFAREERVHIEYEENSFKSIVSIGGHLFHISHGNQITINARTPYYGIENACLKWSQMFPEVRYYMMGHFHTCAELPMNKSRIYIGGTFQERNNFSEGRIKSDPTLEMWLLGLNKKHGVTNQWKVNLT